MTHDHHFVPEQSRFMSSEALWVVLKGGKVRLRITYNPHTSPGRFAVRREDGSSLYVSASEVESCSLEAMYWIRGFLSGSEPPPERMFGEEIYESNLDDPRWSAWREELDTFNRTGLWNDDHDWSDET